MKSEDSVLIVIHLLKNKGNKYYDNGINKTLLILTFNFLLVEDYIIFFYFYTIFFFNAYIWMSLLQIK